MHAGKFPVDSALLSVVLTLPGRCGSNLKSVICTSEHMLQIKLTHWARVMHICVGNLTIIGSDNGLSTGRCQLRHYLNQCWNIVHWTLRNKLQWNFNRNSNRFIQENAFESVVCEMRAILSWPQYVNEYLWNCFLVNAPLIISQH